MSYSHEEWVRRHNEWKRRRYDEQYKQYVIYDGLPIRDVPKGKGGVYVFYDKDLNCLYVGKCGDFRRRMLEHTMDKFLSYYFPKEVHLIRFYILDYHDEDGNLIGNPIGDAKKFLEGYMQLICNPSKNNRSAFKTDAIENVTIVKDYDGCDIYLEEEKRKIID
ncbi:GIY-YIG nuclease family protein [Bacillus sp. ISL-57]|uniref:GIY-YIG nuclease family protein n=1 Tax=Bacillus sp. ISL-57 TaxID=2819135 RepID=UPI001BE5577D|nr:GIY-YIG nuclease family protein [Bacillus sp. ISL-57]MBT2715409.1 GIY-YIG nuclease family protein [Bacillus sp. ISL-57]